MVDTNEIRRIFNELERQAKTLLNAANSFENALRDVDNSVDTRNFFRGIQDILWNFGFKNIRFTARSLERSLDNHYYSGRFGPDFNYSFYMCHSIMVKATIICKSRHFSLNKIFTFLF